MSYNIEYRTRLQPDRRHKKQGAISIDNVSLSFLSFSPTHAKTHSKKKRRFFPSRMKIYQENDI